MITRTILATAVLLAATASGVMPAVASAATPAATPAVAVAVPDAARVKAAHDLMAAMQAEKMMRTTAGMSKYPSEAQRLAVMAKLDKVPAEEIYTRLALPVARLLSTETAAEMTRFYQSSYGQKVLHDTYNGPASLYPADPVPTPKEKKELARPAYIKANQEFRQAEAAIHHESFVLLSSINH